MRALRFLVAIATLGGHSAARAQRPAPTAPVPRVDSVRVDTLNKAGADSLRRVLLPKPPASADTVRKGLFGPDTDLALDVRARIESTLDRRRDERCDNGQLLASLRCGDGFASGFNFEFTMVSTGTVADRVHVNVDYDTQREFDASNALNVYYEGKPTSRIQRLEVGNVAFALPSTRFLSSGVPSGNYGLQAIARVGPLRFQGIAATQKGNIVQDRVFYVGDRTLQSGEREINDNEIEPRRFFFTVDPQLFKGTYPRVDILDRAQLAALAAALPDTIRPRRVLLYRVQFGTQPQNPNGPRFRIIGDPGEGRQTYDVLREGVDYYLDPSQLWFALVRPLNQSNERLVVAYHVRVNDVDTVYPATGGTPDLQYTGSTGDQRANLVYDPNVVPGDPAFRREIRSVYRVGGEEMVRSSTRVRVVSGTGEQEKPASGSFATYLQMFGLAQAVNPASFDIENRLWPRPSDPNYSAAAGGTAGLASAASLTSYSHASAAGSGRIIRDHFVVFPSLQPFAKRDSGLVEPGNPSNEAIYSTPGEYLYSPQHPANVYRLEVGYQTEAGSDAGAILLGSIQVRRGSERIVLDGRPLIRDVDYRIDYELGRLTFARPDTLFNRQRTITARFEENPLFASSPTTLFGVTSTLALKNGELNLIAVQQSQRTDFTRPQLGFEPVSSFLAGVNGQLSWEVAPLTRLVNRLPFVRTLAPSRVSVNGELATSRPRLNSDGQAYVETFESDAGITVNLLDNNWALSSQPADGRRAPQRYGANPFDLRRAATIAFQNNGTNVNGNAITVRSDSIDQNATLAGLGFASQETLLWLTLYPLAIGGRYDPATRRHSWRVGNTPSGRRFRSVRSVLSPAGVDLSRVENLEFWTLVDTSATRRAANPTLIFDLGEISENRIAFAPESLTIIAGAIPDSLFRGKKLQGFDVLDTERDAISRAFNADVNDLGLRGDRIDTLVVQSAAGTARAFDVPLCIGTARAVPRLGDTRTNCTIRNNRLDEEDVDLDNVLNLPSGARDREKLTRFIVDLGDARRWVRFGKTFRQQADSGGVVRTLQWVLVRVPFRAADDTVNDVLLRRVRALRVTMMSGAQAADDEFAQIPLARLKLTGAPWLKRSEQTLAGIAGDKLAGGYTQTSLIGTADKGTLSGDDYQPPPGVTDEADTRSAQFALGNVQINERSLRLQAGNLPVYGRAEAYYRFPNGQQSFMGYQQLRVWARGRRNGWGDRGELQMYVKVGRDANNFYMYRTPVNGGPGQEAWNPEVRVDFERFFALRQKIQNAYLQNRGDTLITCGAADVALVSASSVPIGSGQQRYVACDGGYMVYTVEPGAAPPNLAAVQEMAVGFVRLPSAGGPTTIGPADSLELWVDDIRLAQVVNQPGYAGQVSVALSAADVADFRVGFTKKNPYFRQLTDQPSFVNDHLFDVVGTLHLEKLLPAGLGLAVPLTITHVSASSAPLFLSGTDIPAAGIQSLRAPSTGITSYALSVRRTALMSNALLGALVDNLGLTSTYAKGDSRNEYQAGTNDNFSLSLDYNVAAEARTARLPGLIGLPFARVRGARGAGFDTLNAPTLFRWNPSILRFTSGVVRGKDRRFSYFKPADAFDDSARVSRAEQNLWRNASTLELRPTNALTARWDFISLRDLRDYGDTSAASVAATRSRSRVLGTSAGMERERSLLTSVQFAPQRSQWFKPRADFGTQFGMLRDPNFGSLAELTFGNRIIETLPRRLTVSQTVGGGMTIDVGRALTIYGADSSLARRLAKVFAPFDVTVNRSLLSAYDGSSTAPPLGLQFGVGGVDAFRRINGEFSATTGLTQSISASQSFLFPASIAFVNRYRRTTTRSWTRRIENAQSVADGAQTVFPDVSLRWNWTPPALILPFVKSVGANAGYARSLATTFLPGELEGARPELRGSRVRTIPLNATVAWGFGRGLTTSAGYALTTRADSLPGSIADGRAEEMSADLGRAFRFPKSLGFTVENDIRARIGWQQSRQSTFINDLARGGTSRLADNGRTAISLNADTDLSETVIFTLQGSRVVTYDRNFNRNATQLLFSTVLQVQFFGDAK